MMSGRSRPDTRICAFKYVRADEFWVPGHIPGRPIFPGFVARSRRDPASGVTDPAAWAELWRAARTRLATIEDPGKLNRWSGDEPGCA